MNNEEEAAKNPSPILTTDDESITTTSTESDSFDTWTLVTDKKNKTREAVTAETKENTQKCSGAATAIEDGRIEIVKDKEGNKRRPSTEDDEESDEDNVIEAKEKPNIPQSENETNVDDLSDGISIISESESTGRVSPHPELREHLNQLNLRFATTEDVLFAAASTSRYRPQLTPPNTPVVPRTINLEEADRRLRQRQTNHVASQNDDGEEEADLRISPSLISFSNLPPIIQRGAASAFYISCLLGLLALIGKWRNPVWEPLATDKSLNILSDRVTEMELQSNLLRAEIDLLSKQVSYLNTLNEKWQRSRPIGDESGFEGGHNRGRDTAKRELPQHQHQRQKREADFRKKTFQAWPGNGNSMDPVQIDKGDLKRPYKCADGRFVEIAGMCMENSPDGAAALVDEIGVLVNDVLQQSEAFKTFEKAAEEIHAQSGEDIYTLDKTTAEEEGLKVDAVKPSAQEEPKPAGKYEQYKSESKHKFATNSKEHHERKHRGKEAGGDLNDYKERTGKREHNSKERFSKQKSDFDESKEHFNKPRGEFVKTKQRDNSKERFGKPRDNSGESKERFGKPRGEFDDSKERFKKHDKIRFETYNSKERNSNENRNRHHHNDGQWHEKLMYHREQVRRDHEQQHKDNNNKNWYIKRGDSREQARFADGVRAS